MPKDTDRDTALNQVFMALADPTRRAIVHRLTQGECRVGDVAAGFPAISLAAVSKHIRVLEAARLVRRRVEGRVHWLQLAPHELAHALDWISIYRNYWNQRLDALENSLQDVLPPPTKGPQ